VFLAGGMLLFSLGRGVSVLATRSPQPRMQVVPAEMDFGRVSVGQAVSRSFLIKNNGNARLLVTDIRSTCECTVAELSSRAIMPGDSVHLQVVFKATSAGAKSETVLIQSNDPSASRRIIKVSAQAVVSTQP
jgi:hypothetical protein